MKDFRPLKPNCLLFNNLDIRQLLNSLGLNNIPTKSDLHKVAFSGNYEDLINRPDVIEMLREIITEVENPEDATFFVSPQADWTEADSTKPSYIIGKPTKLSDFQNDENFVKLSYLLNELLKYLLKSELKTSLSLFENDLDNPDWNNIKNRPTKVSQFTNDALYLRRGDINIPNVDPTNIVRYSGNTSVKIEVIEESQYHEEDADPNTIYFVMEDE